MSRALTIESRDGLKLEAALDEPSSAAASLVLCHPHPQMGGTMNAPLLTAVRDELVKRGWNVLRFNFRGIGSSEGATGIGNDEIADALGALDVLRGHGLPVAIAGWSFGAAVAVRVAAEESDLIACAAIAPAVDERPGVTAGIPGDVTPKVPTLVVVGANDELISPARVAEWCDSVGATYVEVRGANHFFWGKYNDLATLITDWLNERLTD
ncbi:MAG: alpha/beta hydrolase [Actinomycetota bacterium]